MMSTLSPAVPIPISQGEQRTIHNRCAPRLRQHRRTHSGRGIVGDVRCVREPSNCVANRTTTRRVTTTGTDRRSLRSARWRGLARPGRRRWALIASPFLYDALACRALRPSVPIAARCPPTVPFAGPCCGATGIGHPAHKKARLRRATSAEVGARTWPNGETSCTN